MFKNFDALIGSVVTTVSILNDQSHRLFTGRRVFDGMGTNAGSRGARGTTTKRPGVRGDATIASYA